MKGGDIVKRFFAKLYKGNSDDFYAMLKDGLIQEKKRILVTANAEIFMKGESDPEIVEMMESPETIISPDGEGIVQGAKSLGYSIWGKIAGVDTVAELFKIGNELNLKLYLYGSKQEVLEALVEKLHREYPQLKVVGIKNGYDNLADDVFDDMAKQQPDIALVALGVPRQEKEIWHHFSQFNKGLFIGCGGSLDVLSGMKKRAPKLFVKMKLEWLYRIACEPTRIKRFYDNNVKYLLRLRKLKKEG